MVEQGGKNAIPGAIDENDVSREIYEQLREGRRVYSEIDRRPRKPLTGYPFSLFGEDVNGPIRNFLYKKRVKMSELKASSKKEDNNSE
jgi:hypothetical protein